MQYPIIKYPKIYGHVMEEQIPVPDFPKKPEKPSKQEGQFGGFTIAGIFVVIIEAMVGASIEVIGVTMSFFFIVDIFSWISDSSKKSNNYKHLLEEYNLEIKKYEEKLIEHRLSVLKIRNSTDTLDYRKKRFLDYIKLTSRPREKYINMNRGKSEIFFYKVLLRWFPTKIFTDHIISRFEDAEPYIPDYIFQDEGSNMHIDIEIDEPYMLNSHEPIHYLEDGTHSDETRDAFFQSMGWFVIRFSEEQVVKYPEACCQVIADLIFEIIGQDFRKDQISSLKEKDCWDYKIALDLAHLRYRENYLNTVEFVKDIIYNQLNSTNERIKLDEIYEKPKKEIDNDFYDLPF